MPLPNLDSSPDHLVYSDQTVEVYCSYLQGRNLIHHYCEFRCLILVVHRPDYLEVMGLAHLDHEGIGCDADGRFPCLWATSLDFAYAEIAITIVVCLLLPFQCNTEVHGPLLTVCPLPQFFYTYWSNYMRIPVLILVTQVHSKIWIVCFADEIHNSPFLLYNNFSTEVTITI